jgi:hypothetical protein
MEATVLEFLPEQGAGRVSVDGAGELPFDATVARVRFDQLVPGRRVHVELGPSRLGGMRVVKLWVPGTEPPPPPSSAPSREVRVGPYTLRLDSSWKNGDVVEKPELARFNGVAAPGVSFDFTALLGAAFVAGTRESVVSTFTKAHAGARYTTWSTTIAGVTFEAHAFDGSPALAPGSRYELYVGAVYDDLLAVGFGLVESEVPKRDAWLRLFSAMTESAIVLRARPTY